MKHLEQEAKVTANTLGSNMRMVAAYEAGELEMDSEALALFKSDVAEGQRRLDKAFKMHDTTNYDAERAMAQGWKETEAHHNLQTKSAPRISKW